RTNTNLSTGFPSNAHGWMRAKLGRRSYALALAGSILRGTDHPVSLRVEGGSTRIAVPSCTDDEPAGPAPPGSGGLAVSDARVAAGAAERQRRDRVYRADRRHAPDAR